MKADTLVTATARNFFKVQKQFFCETCLVKLVTDSDVCTYCTILSSIVYDILLPLSRGPARGLVLRKL